jgi:hypothetical protein
MYMHAMRFICLDKMKEIQFSLNMTYNFIYLKNYFEQNK